MSLRFLGYFALVVFALSLVPGTATAQARAGVDPALAVVATDAYGPNIQIVDLAELDTFSYKLHRELTGAAGQRVYGVFKDGFSDLQGFIPARYPANGRFGFDWEGDVERPGRFLQTLPIGPNDWTEWGVGGKFKGKYNSDALIQNLSERRNEVLFWWDSFSGWLDAYGDSLECATSPRIVNDEQAVRCLAPSLTLNQKIGLLNVLGLFTDNDTQAVSALTFELWLTKNDDIPVRLDVSSSATDVKGNAFSGRFTLEVFYIDSSDIQVDLPR